MAPELYRSLNSNLDSCRSVAALVAGKLLAQPRERQRSKEEPEIAQGDIEIARNQQQIGDDNQEPCRNHVSKNARPPRHPYTRGNFDHANHQHQLVHTNR